MSSAAASSASSARSFHPPMAASSSNHAFVAGASDLDPSTEFLEPPQCSLWFEPKEWSRRYADTFFTCDIAAAAQPSPDHWTIEVKAGENVWTVTKATSEFEQLAKQLSSELIANKHAFVVPELPAKKWSLLSQDTSPEYLAQRAAAYSSWLHQLLGGGARKICLFPSVRTFLELDRPLLKPPQDDDDDDDYEEPAAAAAAAASTTMADN